MRGWGPCGWGSIPRSPTQSTISESYRKPVENIGNGELAEPVPTQMQTLHLPLVQKREIAHDTYSFIFRKPADFTYNAGQYISLCVEPPDIAAPGGMMRELSLVSAPFEDILEVVFRFRDTPAKRSFIELKENDLAYIQGPFGTFRFAEHSSPVVMLAGGIGIAPFLSMVKQSIHVKENRDYFLYYSNRFLKDIPYLPELDQLKKLTKQVTIITTLSRESVATHHSGYISPLLIKKYLTPFPPATYYISGPQRFVGGMWEVLEEMGIADVAIHGEEFTGYE